jgi:hypothetical protein
MTANLPDGGEIQVTPQDEESYYEVHRDEFPVERKARVAHVLAASEALALAAQRSIEQGTAFEEVARSSLDPATAHRGGDMGWVSLRRLPAPLGEAVLGLKPGETSAPVKTDFGYHLVKLLEREPPAVRPLSEIRGIVRDRVRAEMEQAALLGVQREMWAKYRPQVQIETISAFLDDKQVEVVSTTAPGVTAPPPGPRLELLTSAVYAGPLPADGVTLQVLAANLGDEPLEVKKVHSTCACLQGVMRPNTLAPGALGTLEITLRAKDFKQKGETANRLAIETNNTRRRLKMVQVFAEVPPSSAGVAEPAVATAPVQ